MFFDEEQRQAHKKHYTRLTQQQFVEIYNANQAEVLGKGTFGQVWRVVTPQGHEVAIKGFNKNAKNSFKQIMREVDNLKLLQHSNIARFYDCYIVDDEQYYIVIEYCAGGTLTTYLKQHQLNDEQKNAICRDIASGLAYAHEKNIVHRDLKPDNILIGKGGVAKICDFGCSTAVEQAGGCVMNSRIGSPAYWDRRINNGDPYDMSVDIYALGLVFVAVFKGKGIFDECSSLYTLERLRSKIESNFQENMEQLLEGIPFATQNIIKNCLQSDHTQRYTAKQIVHLLAKEIENKSLSRLMSTVDEEDIQDESSVFAVELMRWYRKTDTRQQNLSTYETLLRLLNNSKESMAQIEVISQIRYIDPRTKEQYCTLLLFYYSFWLNNLRQLISNEPTEFALKYPEIVVQAIGHDMLERVEGHIKAQLSVYSSFMLKCCRKVNNIMRLLDQRIYMPEQLKRIVNKVALMTSIDYKQFNDEELREMMLTFYEKRVENEFMRNIGNTVDEKSQQDLKKLESIAKSIESGFLM